MHYQVATLHDNANVKVRKVVWIYAFHRSLRFSYALLIFLVRYATDILQKRSGTLSAGILTTEYSIRSEALMLKWERSSLDRCCNWDRRKCS